MSFCRILIIANKWFEADPLLGVLANPAARPPSITDLGTVLWPRVSQQSLKDIISRPRSAFLFGKDRSCLIEVWCIQDLMNPFLSYSSTAEKARVLPDIFSYGKEPDFVAAFGTAGFPDAVTTRNGNVVVGARTFLHNPYQDKPNAASNWNAPDKMDKVIESAAEQRNRTWCQNVCHAAIGSENFVARTVQTGPPAPVVIFLAVPHPFFSIKLNLYDSSSQSAPTNRLCFEQLSITLQPSEFITSGIRST